MLLGQNGTGKSNLLEALIIIFRDLDLGESPAFTYTLDYECRGDELHSEADHTQARRGEQVQITVNMQRDNARAHVAAEIPEKNPQGMGVAAILTSDLFGLHSTLDKPAQDRLRQSELRFTPAPGALSRVEALPTR